VQKQNYTCRSNLVALTAGPIQPTPPPPPTPVTTTRTTIAATTTTAASSNGIVCKNGGGSMSVISNSTLLPRTSLLCLPGQPEPSQETRAALTLSHSLLITWHFRPYYHSHHSTTTTTTTKLPQHHSTTATKQVQP